MTTSRDSLFQMTAQQVTEYLDRNMPLEPGTKIQYGHPSPRFWETRQPSFEELFRPVVADRPLNLYLHVPFCPPTKPGACGFCLFSREDFRTYDVVDAYMRNLHAELDKVGRLLGRRELNTIYVGGGTPNILRADAIRALFAGIRTHFVTSENCEITFEGTPGLFTLDRLEALTECGVTRISNGAQMLKPHLVAYSGRKQRPEQIRRTAEFCADHGMRCSVDLITGWFEQTPQDLIDDIDTLNDWGVTEIVNHPLTLAGESEFARRRSELPKVSVTCKTFLTARDHLHKLGFRADSYTDYCRSTLPPVRFLDMYRDALRNDRVGVGYGANSLLAGTLAQPGHTFRNVEGVGPYDARVQGGGSCAESIFRFSREDLRLLFVLKGLEGTPYLDAREYKAMFGTDLVTDLAPWWQALEVRGWLEWKGTSAMLVGEGVFYTSTVQRCISELRNRELRALAAPQPSAVSARAMGA